MNVAGSFDDSVLPEGIRSRFVDDVNGLRMHVLEAGFEELDRPCLILLHGFPELAYSWRKVMVPLAEAGFYVVAPDQRGYGRTTGWDPDYDGDVRSFRMLNVVRDTLTLVHRLGRTTVASVIGHDFGSPAAAWCALARPDVFRSVVMMSAPFDGPPEIPAAAGEGVRGGEDIHTALAALDQPRKHYQWYYSTRTANEDMLNCRQGVHNFLRAYYHHKSADWSGNAPFPLESWTAAELAKMPTYYIMDLDRTMAETVEPEMPSAEEIAASDWLTDAELAVYAEAFSRTGFQGCLQWYRCATGAEHSEELRLFAGRTIDVPACFIAGAQDWGIHQKPGALEAMRSRVCTRMSHFNLVDRAGHWVQQERPEKVCQLLKVFLSSLT